MMTAAELLAHPLTPVALDAGERRYLEALASGEVPMSHVAEALLAQKAERIRTYPARRAAIEGNGELDDFPEPGDEPPPERDELEPVVQASRFLSDAELATLPPIAWDIDGILPTGGLTYLVGLKGVGKSLLALDFACSLALGRPWYDRAVRRCGVIYIAAEGARSLHTRLGLWKGYHGVEPESTGVRWVPRRLALLDRRSVEDFIADAVTPEPPGQIIVDTLPRCTQGMNENDSEGMGQALDAVDHLRETLGCGVLLVTHPAREGGDLPRGHSSQESAADAILCLKDQDGERVLSFPKQKDGDESQTFSLTLAVFPASSLTGVARPASVLLLPSSRTESQSSRLTPSQRTVLATIRDVDHGPGVAAAVIIDVCRLHKGSVYRVLKHLHDRGYVSVKAQRYSVTLPGLSQLVAPVASESHDSRTEPLAEEGDESRTQSRGSSKDPALRLPLSASTAGGPVKQLTPRARPATGEPRSAQCIGPGSLPLALPSERGAVETRAGQGDGGPALAPPGQQGRRERPR